MLSLILHLSDKIRNTQSKIEKTQAWVKEAMKTEDTTMAAEVGRLVQVTIGRRLVLMRRMRVRVFTYVKMKNLPL